MEDLTRSVIEVCEEWSGFDGLRGVVEKYSSLEWYVAGGVVRDILGGVKRKPKDFDIFVTGRRQNDVLEDLASRGTIDRGQFGAPRWTPNNKDGRYADIIFVENFNNGLSRSQTIVDALRQFDFSANAVAVNLMTGDIVDPIGGGVDARNRVLRGVRFDYPDELISDSLNLSRLCVLWCRLWHYAAALGFEIEPVTLQWLDSYCVDGFQMSRFESAFFSIDKRLMRGFKSDSCARLL